MNTRYTESFSIMRNRLFNDALLWICVTAIPGVGLSLSRALVIGWQAVMLLHMLVLCALWLLWTGRGRIPYQQRVLGLLAITWVTTLAGLVILGPVAPSSLYAVLFAFIAALFLGGRLAWWLIAANTISLMLIGLAASQHWLKFDLNYQIYAYHPLIWVSNIWNLSAYSCIFAFIAWRMLHELIERESQAQRLLINQSRTAENVPGLIYQFVLRCDGSSAFTYTSNGLLRMFGITAEVLNKDSALIFALLHPDDASRVLETIQRSARNLLPIDEIFRIIHPQRGIVWIERNSIPERLANGDTLWNGYMRDITALKVAEQRLTATLESAPNVAVQWYDQDGRVLYWNHASEQLFGWSAKEATGKTLDQLIYPEAQLQDFLATLASIAANGTAIGPLDHAVRHRDGRDMIISSTTFAIPGDLSPIFVSIDIDLTKRKEAEAELKNVALCTANTLSLMEATLEATDNGILVVDLEGKVVLTNQRFTQMWRISAELLAKNAEEKMLACILEQVQHPEQFSHTVKLIYAKPESVHYDSVKFRDGRIFARVTHPQRVNGEIVGRVWSFLDITSQQEKDDHVIELSQALGRQLNNSEQQREQLKSLLNAIPDLVWMKDHAGKYIFCNPAFEKLIGVAESQLLGKSDLDFFPKALAEAFRKDDRSATESAAPVTREEWVTFASDGRHALLETVKSAIRAQDGRLFGVLGIARDVTQARSLLDNLNTARAEAQKSNEAKSMFLASMSHELRTPLNAIIGFAQMLDMGMPVPLAPSQQEPVRHILGSGRHLLGLINEVLDLTRIEAGQLFLTNSSVNMREVIENIISLSQPAAAGRRITIRHTCSADIQVLADSARVRQILLNLLSNAIKYNREDGLVVVSCQQKDKVVLISVSDTGAGIPEEQHARLFQPFQRLGAEQTVTEGTGIGLVICKKLAEAMEGRIGFESKAGIGSRFWVELPAAIESTRHAATEILTVIDAPDNSQVQGRVLYVEDSPINVSVMEHIFSQFPGVELLIAQTAEAGLDIIRANPPDLVLMDINLPGMSGLEALRLIKSDPHTAAIAVIAVSAAALPQDVKDGLEVGFSAYFTKPFDVQELIAMVRKILGTRGCTAENIFVL